MTNGQLGAVATQLQRLFGRGTVAGLTERQLLERFTSSGDDAAFEALVLRHGPMVLTVCRRLLTDPNDVEDAFRATFLVLVRKAGSIQRPDRLGNWLYGVAHRVAARARIHAQRRKAREPNQIDLSSLPGPAPSAADDLGPLLHEELGRLPEKYRAPLVLCYLEGLTHEQAAHALGWRLGTVKGRLARGKDQLRGRLTRRGLTLPAGIVAATLARDARAALPPVLLNSTVKAATGFAAGQSLAAGTVSAAAALLANEVLKTMFTTKLKVLTLSLLATSALGGGAGAFALQGDENGPAGTGSGEPRAERTEGEPKTAALTDAASAKVQDKAADSADADAVAKARAKLSEAQNRLARIKAEKALNDYKTTLKDYVHLRSPMGIDALYKLSIQAMMDEREASGLRADQLTALRDHLDRMTSLEQAEQDRRTNLKTQDEHEEREENLPTSLTEESKARLQKQRTEMKRAVQRLRPFEFEKSLAEIGLHRAEAELWLAEAKTGVEPNINGTVRSANAASTKPAPAGPPQAESPDEDAEKTAAIEKALSSIISMPFANETPLKDVIKYIKTATINNILTDGIPVYLDPAAFKYGPVFYGGGGIQLERPKSLEDATITLNLEGVRLRTCLRLMLNQLGLAYTVKEGLLIISSPNSPEIKTDAGGMGGMGGMGGGMGGMR